MRGRNAEGLPVYATGHGEIVWDDESLELCLDDLIETNLLPALGRPEGPVERASQPADRAIAYLIMGSLVEWADWTPEMIRERERGEIKLGEMICDGLPAWGQKSLQTPLEQIPRNNFRSEMVAMKVTPLRSPKVVVCVDGNVGVSPRHLRPNYIGPPWCLIEVDWAGLKLLRAPAEAEPAPTPPTELPRVEPGRDVDAADAADAPVQGTQVKPGGPQLPSAAPERTIAADVGDQAGAITAAVGTAESPPEKRRGTRGPLPETTDRVARELRTGIQEGRYTILDGRLFEGSRRASQKNLIATHKCGKSTLLNALSIVLSELKTPAETSTKTPDKLRPKLQTNSDEK
jgi:hypothetical protein